MLPPGLRHTTISLILLLGVSAAVYGDPTYTLGEIVVAAPRRSAGPATPLPVTTVTAAEISQSGAVTAADALDSVPGVVVNDQGPLGSVQTVSLRGSTSTEVLVLVDGVPQNTALSASVDLSTIPASEIERIEVIRGGASALYGPDAVGGVIDIITKKSVAAPLALTVENGSYLPGAHLSGFGTASTMVGPDFTSLVDTQRIALQAGTKIGSVDLRLSGNGSRASNGYLYLDSNDESRSLANAALWNGSGTLSARAPIGSGTLTVGGSALYQSHGVPGTETLPTPDALEVDSKIDGTLHYQTSRFLSDSLGLDLLAHVGTSAIDYTDPSSSLSSNQQVTTIDTSLSQEARLGERVVLRYGGSASYDAALGSDVGAHERTSLGGWAGSTIDLGRWSIEPTLRYDYASDVSSGSVSALLGLSYHLSPALVLTGNLSRSVRVPTFEDLYWPDAGGVAGNPSLTSEIGWGSQIGLRVKLGGLSYDLSAFGRYVQDVILWQPGSDGIWRPTNYGVALYPGIDQELRVDFAPHYSFDLAYTFLYTFALSGGLTLADGKRVPMVPVNTASATVGYEKGGFSWSVNARYESLRYEDDANTIYLPSFFLVNLRVKWDLGRSWSAYLAVENLFSEQYQIQAGYPMPPAELRTGITLRV